MWERSCRRTLGWGRAPALPAELGLVLPADFRERVEDVAGVVAVQTVEVEVEGVEAGPQVPAARFRDSASVKSWPVMCVTQWCKGTTRGRMGQRPRRLGLAGWAETLRYSNACVTITA